MGLLERYLAKEILLPFLAALLFLTQLLLMTQILARADILFGAGVTAVDVAAVAEKVRAARARLARDVEARDDALQAKLKGS